MYQMQPVMWTKGVLLSPQHLQVQDRYLEDQIRFRLGAVRFSPWGFRTLVLDHEALAGGAIALGEASGLFPDGLAFDCPGTDRLPPPRSLDGCFAPDQQSLTVFLAVPEHRPGSANVGTTMRDDQARYVADVALRRDETTGLAERPIQIARANLRLLVDGDAVDGHALLPVARVLRREGTGFAFDESFVPPLLDIAASPRLMAIARRLVEVCSAKSTELGGARRQRNLGLADFSITDIASFWLLYTVNTHLPQLRHLYESRRGHPVELYSALVALGGALTTFAQDLHPRDFPAYDHANLGGCFSDLERKLDILLETVVPANCVSLKLRETSPGLHTVALDQDAYVRAPALYLAVSVDGNRIDAQRRIPTLLKVASADHVSRLVSQALSGVPLEYTPNPPTAVPVKATHDYFLVGRTGEAWDGIAQARTMGVYVPRELVNASVELVVVLPPRAG